MENTSIILIVDDDEFGRKTLEALLESPTYTLAFACNGSEALVQAVELTPDLILLDVIMPDMDGFEVCRHLRADPRLAEVPVIMVTALDDRTSRLKGIESGADDLITKPFDSVELRTRVRTITRLNRYRRLLTERARFERLTELAPDGIVIVDSHGSIRLTNPAFLRMLSGADESTTIGANIRQFIVPEHATMVADWLSHIISASMASRVETECMRVDGHRFPVEINAGHVNWDNSPAAQIIVRDITSRKQAEEALRESEKHLRRSRDALRALFDGLDDSLALLDSDGRLLALNQAMSLLLGKPPTELVSHVWNMLCQSMTPAFPGQSALKTLHDGRARHHHETYTGPDGQNRILDIQTLPLIGPEQTVDQVIIRVIDVTDQLQMEALARQNEHFAARGRMAASIAHEVNTPLQSIQNCLYLAGKANNRQREAYLELAREELDRISAIVRQLLHLHHPRDDSAPIQINPNTVIQRILLLTGSTLANHGIDVECDLFIEPPLFYGYPDHLTQVFLNLILNAIDAMPDGGKFRIKTWVSNKEPSDIDYTPPRRWRDALSEGQHTIQKDTVCCIHPSTTGHGITDANHLVIQMSDTGRGIRPDIQARMFEPFFTTKTQGTGVGLSISQRIISQHGGQIKVHSIPEQGTTFTLILPLQNEGQEIENRGREIGDSEALKPLL
jgi:PAS domain S-box-containing protein